MQQVVQLTPTNTGLAPSYFADQLHYLIVALVQSDFKFDLLVVCLPALPL